MTGWRGASVTGFETGSYSDSEAPDAPERCKINELGTLRGSSICVAARTGETDILARVMTFFCSKSSVWLCCGITVSTLARAKKIDKEKCRQLMLLHYLPRAPSRTRYGVFEWAMRFTECATDHRACRVHRTEPTGAGTRTICPVHSKET